jgi:hypothetical protein
MGNSRERRNQVAPLSSPTSSMPGHGVTCFGHIDRRDAANPSFQPIASAAASHHVSDLRQRRSNESLERWGPNMADIGSWAVVLSVVPIVVATRSRPGCRWEALGFDDRGSPYCRRFVNDSHSWSRPGYDPRSRTPGVAVRSPRPVRCLDLGRDPRSPRPKVTDVLESAETERRSTNSGAKLRKFAAECAGGCAPDRSDNCTPKLPGASLASSRPLG